jgi:gag-polypeptide of LTR copia-type
MSSLPSIAPLNGSNYGTWSVRSRGFLVSRRLQSAIDPPPENGQADPAAAAAIDEEARMLLLSLMDDVRLEQNMHFTTARELWQSLKTSYERGLPARRNALHRELNNIRLGKMTINTYMDTIKALQSQLNALGNTKTNDELVRIALDGLRDHKEYDIVVSLIEELDPVPDIGEVQSRLSTTEQKNRERGHSERPRDGESRAYLARSGNSNGNNSNNDARGCYVCGGPHQASKCYRRFGQPGWISSPEDGHRGQSSGGAHGRSGGAPPVKTLAF